MITVAILLPVDNRRYFTIGAILDNRLVLTINRTKLLDYRKNDFHLLCSSLVYNVRVHVTRRPVSSR